MTFNAKKATIVVMKAQFALAILMSLACTRGVEARHCNKPPIRIAIIDSGFGYQDKGHEANLCRYGHKDFTIDRQFSHAYDTKDLVPVDVHSHGTNIAGIIDEALKKAHINYCLVIIKYYSEQQSGAQNLLATIRSINYAANIHAEYINYSGGGPEQNLIEKAAIERYLNHGGHMIAAAGNEGEDLGKPENAYYPALYDKRIIVVGNLCKDGVEYKKSDETIIKRCPSSNYGTAVTRWEVGEAVTGFGITQTGTSQATAVATGEIISESDNKCDIGF